ncbi:MAG: hypothetical protein IPJ78_15805 [Gemmatimonadetes bacterium]|nr:hypothetical protein [Gemmatimonadota bacterium]
MSRAEYPRTVMLGLVSVASSVGFLLTAGMRHVGITAPGVRYPLAALGGYIAFFVLIRMWLAWRRGEDGWDIQPDGTAPYDLLSSGVEPMPMPMPTFGGGGGFGGGGSSASFGAPGDASALVGHAAEVKASVAETALGAVGEADEGVVLLVPLVIAGAVLVGLGASVSVLYEAPALFAEVLLDGAIATAVYRRLRLRSTEHWSSGVMRRTWKPMLAIFVALLGLGIAIPFLVPGADSIGDLLRWSANAPK